MTDAVFGRFQPGEGWLFRTPVGWKYLLLLALSVPAFAVHTWWLTLALLVLAVGLLLSSGISVARAFNVGWFLWLILAATAVAHLLAGQMLNALLYPGNIMIAVLAARMVTLTSPIPDLIEALSRGLRYLPGVPADIIALAVALMIRSVPYLVGAVEEARDAANARGLTRNPVRLLTPVMLSTVAYAERTGEALAARGVVSR